MILDIRNLIINLTELREKYYRIFCNQNDFFTKQNLVVIIRILISKQIYFCSNTISHFQYHHFRLNVLISIQYALKLKYLSERKIIRIQYYWGQVCLIKKNARLS